MSDLHDEPPYLDEARVFSDISWTILRDYLANRVHEDAFIVMDGDNGPSIWRGLTYDHLYVDEAACVLVHPQAYRDLMMAANKGRRRRMRLARRHRQMPRGM